MAGSASSPIALIRARFVRYGRTPEHSTLRYIKIG